MHELSITKTIIAELERAAKDENFEKVSQATLYLGRLTTFKKEPILYYFTILKEESELLKDAELLVDEIEGEIRCNQCGKEGIVDEEIMILCPACESADVEIIKGKDLLIKELKGK